MAEHHHSRSLFWRTVDYTRFNLLVLGVGMFFLIGAGQGADIVLGLANNHWVVIVLFYFGVSLWAWQSWFWARYILGSRKADTRDLDQDDVTFDIDARSHRGGETFTTWYPRVLGLVAFGSAILVLGTTHGFLDPLTLGAVVLAGLYLTVVIKRRAWRDALARRMPERFGPDRRSPLVWITIGLSLSTAVVAGGAALYDPVAFGFFVGSAPVLFLALASILPIGSLLIHLTQEHGLPVIKVLVVVSLTSAFWVENHQVRTIGVDSQDRPDIWSAMTAFEQRIPGDERTEIPAVFVATAGGGIRAAYWTAKVLSSAENALRDSGADTPFSDHLVAISGVSGGSVGSAFYLAALADLGAEADKQAKLDTALSKDFLGPALTGLMVQDLMQTVVPWTLFEGRGAILERAFERAWGHEAPDGVGSLALPTSDLDGIQDRWFPRLLLNGTNDTTGQRMIAGTLPIRDANGHQVIVNALDQHAFLFPPDDGKPVPDLRLSTAAHNSARFPVVSPGGVLNNGGSAVVDGGYFENFGAATLVDLLDYLKERRRGPERPTRIIRPILIQISSDPDLGDQLGQDVPMETEIDGSLLKTGLKNRLWNLVGDPMGGVLSPRSARGVLAGQRLRLWAADIGFGDDRARIVEPLWLHFRMDKPSESVPGCKELAEVAAEPPLGWVLSQDSRDTIDHMINCVPHNADQMEKLVSAITATATPRQ